MNTGIIKMCVLGSFLLVSQAGIAQFDDTYFNAKDDAAFVANFRNETPARQRQQQEEVYVSEEENENLDEYSYSSRINRFHRSGLNGNNYSNFDNWWNGCDNYSPNYGFGNTFNTRIYYGSPWGGGFGYSPMSSWGMSPWNSFGWNSWNPFWGYNSWNNWGFTPMSMYSWPYYGGGYGFGNSYFINNYYGYGSPWVHQGNGWNGWNGNGGEPTDRRYMSRKGGSVSSSVKGRDASPRRVLVSDNNQKEEKTGTAQDAATTTRNNSTDRVRKSSVTSDNGNTQNASSRSETRRAVQNPVRNQDSYNQRDFQDSHRFDNSSSRNSWDSSPSRSGAGNQGSSFRSSGGSSGGGGGSRRGGGK